MVASADQLRPRSSWLVRVGLLFGALCCAVLVVALALSNLVLPPLPPVARLPDPIASSRPLPPDTSPSHPTEPTRPSDQPRAGDESIILHTVGGDVVLTLYPEAAPKNVAQLLRLVRLGGLDLSHFLRRHASGFLMLSNSFERLQPLSDRQARYLNVRYLNKVPLEQNALHHRRGALQIPHDKDKSDTTVDQFGIVLNDRLDLDGQYTIFGRVEMGMDVVERLEEVPTTLEEAPVVRLTVIKAEVVPTALLADYRPVPPQPLRNILNEQWPVVPEAAEFRTAVARRGQALLQEKCARCHKPNQAEGGLDVTTAGALRRGGKHGPVVYPGNALGSPLYLRFTDEGPPHPAAALQAVEADLLQLWIDRGAVWPGADQPAEVPDRDSAKPEDANFWSFRPLQTPTPPSVRAVDWPRTPIDRFILAGLEGQHLVPNPAADRRVLARRLWFDLTGLPPEPAELEVFLADKSPNAYEKQVDRLLASPRYGERWGRHWLDVARYADSCGYEDDNDRPNAYWYRDFVVRALNDDLPFDVFLRWQIAGDELEPTNRWAVAATGFVTAGPNQDFRPRMVDRYDELDDVVSTVGASMLGLTVGCARCHDHKYDPISQREYYRLSAVFAGAWREHRRLPTESGERLADALLPLVQRAADTSKWSAAEREAIRAEMAKIAAEWPRALAVVGDGTSPFAYFLERGDDRKERDGVTPGFLTVVTPGRPVWRADAWTAWSSQARKESAALPRTALANWLTDVDGGAGRLAARVVVNRLWQHHLGEGLAATPNDFGQRGARPSHPELLDWLARDLITHGWKLKRLHKMIVMSATYQQDGSSDPAKVHADPENRLFGRHRSQRLTSDALRDAILAVSGNLNEQMYGPSIKPPIPREAILPVNQHPDNAWPADAVDGPANWRRSLYICWQRGNPLPFLQLFDSPEASLSCARRSRTTAPTQALLLMNDPILRAQAHRFAARVQTLVGRDRSKQVRQAFLLALNRLPEADEEAKAVRFLQRADDAGAGKTALADFCQVLFQTNEFFYVD